MRPRATLLPPLAGVRVGLLLVPSGCSSATTTADGQQDLVTAHGLQGLDALGGHRPAGGDPGIPTPGRPDRTLQLR